jgi:hypothetical protein
VLLAVYTLAGYTTRHIHTGCIHNKILECIKAAAPYAIYCICEQEQRCFLAEGQFRRRSRESIAAATALSCLGVQTVNDLISRQSYLQVRGRLPAQTLDPRQRSRFPTTASSNAEDEAYSVKTVKRSESKQMCFAACSLSTGATHNVRMLLTVDRCYP